MNWFTNLFAGKPKKEPKSMTEEPEWVEYDAHSDPKTQRLLRQEEDLRQQREMEARQAAYMAERSAEQKAILDRQRLQEEELAAAAEMDELTQEYVKEVRARQESEAKREGKRRAA
ncbi:MAG: hypothetical protein ABH846_00145 [Patescibacteria group bacterium]